MEKITAVYCRTACQHPDDPPACALQASMALRYAYKSAYANVRLYTDSGYSGLNFERPAFQEMQRDISEGRVQAVIVTGIDRIGRNLPQAMGWIARTRAQGVRVVAIDHGLDFADALLDVFAGK